MDIDKTAQRNLHLICRKLAGEENRMKIDLFLAGSTAERFNMPVAPTWVKSKGANSSSHALISDFDYMLWSTSVTASFAEDSNSTFVAKHLDPGFVSLTKRQNNEVFSSTDVSKWVISCIEQIEILEFEAYTTSKKCCFCCTRANEFRISTKEGPSH